MPRYTKLSTTLGLPGAFLQSFPTVPGNISLLFDLGITQAALPFADEYPRCQQYSTGLNLRVQVIDNSGNPLDISAATALKLRLGLPDGTSEDRVAQFLTDGSDGLLQYQTLFGDLAQTGLYSIQAEIITPSGMFPTSKGFFNVLDNVDNN